VTILRRPTLRGLVVGIAAAGLLLLPALGCGETPSEGYTRVLEMSKRGDWGGVYDRLDKKSQGRLDVALEIASDERGPSGRALFVSMAPSQQELRRRFDPDVQVLTAKVDGDRATLLVRPNTRAHHEQTVSLIKEDGVWKMSIDALELGPLAPAPRAPSKATAAAAEEPEVRSTLETECGKLVYVLTMGDRSLQAAFPKTNDASSLAQYADAIDRVRVDAERVPLTVPELKSASAEFQSLKRDEAKATRDMVRALEAKDVTRAGAADEAMEKALKREQLVARGVYRFCGR
jgi:hypothetical protein